MTQTIRSARFSLQLAVSLLACMPGWGGDAELILYNGKIITVDSTFSIQQAVAIANGKITAVGSSAEILRYEKGSHTRTIELHGRTVLPGLIDAHVHPLEAGLSEYRGPLSVLHSFAEIQSYARRQAARTPPGQWIFVPKTFPTRLREMRMPTRQVLDVVSDHPVYYDASYAGVLNSLALKICNITRETPNPTGGEIVRDADGEPTGILRNATALLKRVPIADPGMPASHAEQLDALTKMLQRYVQAGLTTIGDRGGNPFIWALYSQLKAEKRLPLRVVMTWRMPTDQPAAQLAAEITRSPWRSNQGDAWLKLGSFKVILDGGMLVGTAYQLQPYGPYGAELYGLDDSQNRGQLFVPPDKLLTIMRAARDKGWQLSAHSQGSGAVDVLLNVFETLNRERPLAPTRSHVIHASFQSPELIARQKPLGVLADAQPDWLYLDGAALEKVQGDQGMKLFIPLRTYLDNGIIVAGGSDHMIGFDKNTATNPYNPFLGMWIAITRRTIQGALIHPEQRLTRQEALKMFTLWPAYLQFNEQDRGSIETGKLADLVVIDRDYLTCPEDEIKDIEPVMTIIGGKIAYDREK
jgi:predicted amidohydrolase YtcJ